MKSRNWSALPRDLLKIIGTKLQSLNDVASYISVCSWWKKSMETGNRFLGLPMLTEIQEQCSVDCSKPRELCFPHRYYCCGYTLGWFAIFCDSSDVHLFNPLSGKTFQLPSSTSLPLGQYGDVEKIILSSEPTMGTVVIAMYKTRENLHGMVFCRIGDETWMDIIINYSKNRYLDARYYKDKIYAIKIDSLYCDIIDINHDVPIISMELPFWGGKLNKRNLVVLDNTLFLVENVIDYVVEENRYRTIRFKVHNLEHYKEDSDNNDNALVKNIGDNALFVGNNKCFALSVTEFLGCKPNSIYFTVGEKTYDAVGQDVYHDLGVFDIDGEREIEYIYGQNMRLERRPPVFDFTPSTWLQRICSCKGPKLMVA